jgi:hypothetical protein
MAIADLDYRFTERKRSQVIMDAMVLDPELEEQIDRAGRYKVFAEAKRLGWDGKQPPKWVWMAILSSLANPDQSKGRA